MHMTGIRWTPFVFIPANRGKKSMTIGDREKGSTMKYLAGSNAHDRNLLDAICVHTNKQR